VDVVQIKSDFFCVFIFSSARNVFVLYDVFLDPSAVFVLFQFGVTKIKE